MFALGRELRMDFELRAIKSDRKEKHKCVLLRPPWRREVLLEGLRVASGGTNQIER